MTIIRDDLYAITGAQFDGTLEIRSRVLRPGEHLPGAVTPWAHTIPIVAGKFETPDLDPGPAVLTITSGSWSPEPWEINIPDSAEPLSLTAALEMYSEYEPGVISEAWQAANQARGHADRAEAARDESVGAAERAETAAGNVESVMGDAAAAIRGQVETDADRAEAARTGAETAQTAAETAATTAGEHAESADTARSAAASSATAAAGSATTAGSAASAAAGAAGDAGDAASAAAGSASSASSARSAAQVAQSGAETAATAASTSAGHASSAATSADTSRGQAQSAAQDAETYRDAALAARTDAREARDAAAGYVDTVDALAGQAGTARDESRTYRDQARSARDEFGLSVSASSVAHDDDPTATVTGGPDYKVALSIPKGAPGKKGDRGEKGDQGDGLELAGRVATYGDLPTGLGSAGAGDPYLVDADGLIYIWSGTDWPTEGDGLALQGAKGDPGDKGDQGDEGPAGPANSLSVGSVTQGSTPSANIHGPAPSQTLDLVLPRGEQGPKGDTGSRGPKGDDGDRGPKGDDGPPGTTDWSGLEGVPDVFPPASHQHTAAQISDATPTGRQVLTGDAAQALAALGAIAAADIAALVAEHRPAGITHSGDGPPPSSIPGAKVGDWWLDEDTMDYYRIEAI